MASMGNAQRGALGGLAKLGEGARTTSDLSRVGGGLSRGANEGKKLNAAPWSDTWPAAGATLDLDFANNRGFVRGVGQGGVMDAITFTRASSGTFVKPDGTLSTHSSNGALGNNLLSFPQDFNNTAWGKSNITVTANTGIAPNGTNTAYKIDETTANNFHFLQTQSIVSGIQYTYSFYAKGAERNIIAIGGAGLFASNNNVQFDLNLGTTTNSGTNPTATSSIENVGNDWYRCIITYTATGTAGFTVCLDNRTIFDTDNADTLAGPSYTGNSESGIFIWGAQLEVGSTATEYFPTNIGEPRFDWASTEQVAQRNLLTFTEEFDNSGWTKTNATVSADTVDTTDPLGGNAADKLVENSTTNIHQITQNIPATSIGQSNLIFSVYVKAAERSSVFIMQNTTSTASANHYGVQVDLTNGTIQATSVSGNDFSPTIQSVGSGWYRIAIYFTAGTGASRYIGVSLCTTTLSAGSGNSLLRESYLGNGNSGVYIWGAQLEIEDTATDYQAVGSAVPSTTPLRANPTSNGILIEEARTNRLLWNRDATQTEWVKTNITAVKDQTGIDGVANAASSLTATDDNGTCIQTITLGAGNRTGSVYLKRLTGTGLIQVTLDGSTYSTVELSDTEWYRIVLSGSVTNPTVGIKIAVDGDAVAMDYGQVEDGLFVTTPILTTTATATRAIDSASVSNFTNKYWMNQEYGTINIEVSFITNNNTNANFTFLSIDNGSNNWFRLSRSDSGGAYLRLEWAYRTTLYGTINQNIGTNLTGSQQLSGTSINKIAVNMQPNNYIFSLQNENVNFKAESRFPNTVLTKETGTLSFGSMSWIKRLVYFPKTTNDNQLEAITR
jgi:hypothetical protein